MKITTVVFLTSSHEPVTVYVEILSCQDMAPVKS